MPICTICIKSDFSAHHTVIVQTPVSDVSICSSSFKLNSWYK